MAATDLQQPENISQITGPLGNFVDFKNGKSSPDRTDSGAFAVYGSNGEIGKADVTNAPESTLVVGRVGSYCGSVHYSPNKCWVTDNAIIGSSKSQKDSRFWFYKLASLDLNNYRAGSGQPLLNQQILNGIQVSIPASENDRFQIAKALAVFDDKIDLNRRINLTLEATAQAIFKSWFVDFDPVKAKIAAKLNGRDQLRAAMSAISGKTDAQLDALPRELYEQLAATADLFPDEMVDSELGEIPRGWVVRPMPESIEINPTRQLKKGVVAPYLDMANVPTNSSRAQTVVLREFASGSKFINGDTLLARITPCLENGKTAFVDFLGNDQIGWGSTEFIVLRPKGNLPVEFAYFLCRHPDFRAFAIAQMAGTSGRQRVPNDCFANYLLTVPSQEVAVAFGVVAKCLMSQIRSQDEASKFLAALRDTLLPKLLSGELSVQAVEPELAA